MQVILKNVGECLARAEGSGIYYAILKNKGRQIRKSLRTTSRPMAERERDRLRAGVRQLRVVGGSFKAVAELAIGTKMSGKKPSSLKRRLVSLRHIMPWFEKKLIASIKPEDIDTFVTERSEQVGNRTFNLDLETLHMVFRFAIARGMILDNPASHVERRKLEHRQPIIPTKEEFSLLVSTIRKIDPRACYSADLLELLAYSGMRVGEAATSLKWRHVDFQRRTLHITGGAGGTKNHHERTIPLFPSLEKFLVDLKERRMRQLKLRRLDDFSVVPILSAKIAINSACKAANLQHFHHHLCRHFFCSNAIEENIDFRTIAGWLGHSDGGILVAKTYGHLRDAHSRTMADKMTFSVAA